MVQRVTDATLVVARGIENNISLVMYLIAMSMLEMNRFQSIASRRVSQRSHVMHVTVEGRGSAARVRGKGQNRVKPAMETAISPAKSVLLPGKSLVQTAAAVNIW